MESLLPFVFIFSPGVAFYVAHVYLLLFKLTIRTLYECPIHIDFRCSLLLIECSKNRTQKFQNTFFLVFLSVSRILQVEWLPLADRCVVLFSCHPLSTFISDTSIAFFQGVSLRTLAPSCHNRLYCKFSLFGIPCVSF